MGADALGGIENVAADGTVRKPGDTLGAAFTRTERAQCFPLYTVLLALGNPTVDYLVLDIEGAELQVLRTVPWDKVDIRVLDIEMAHAGEIFDGSQAEIRQLLADNGYRLADRVNIDDLYVKADDDDFWVGPRDGP